MDLLRTAINAFFYSAPIEMIGEKVACKNGSPSTISIDEEISEILKWEDCAHTKSEMQLLVEAINNNWCVSDELGITVESHTLLDRFPLMLNTFASKVLIVYGRSNPIVRFNDLLRWRASTLNVGEDIFTTAFLAWKDVNNRIHNREFLWLPTLPHDNIRINAILDEELSDTHAHINASTDVFEFNWLRLMNNPGRFIPKKVKEKRRLGKTCWLNGERKSYDIVKRHYEGNFMNHSLMEWSVVGAAIMALLFCRLNGLSCKLTRQRIVEMYYALNFDFDSIEEISTITSILEENALRTNNGIILDYAIREEDFTGFIPESPLMVHYGERKFLYDWFYAYFGNRDGFRDDADLMLLYLVIKGKIRREFIQTNSLVGFANFQDYDGVKFQFLPEKGKDKSFWKKYREIVYRYAVQTALCSGRNIHLEARITPYEINNFYDWDYCKSIFGDSDFLVDGKYNPITFVAHFIKFKDTGIIDGLESRHSEMRRELSQLTDKILLSMENHQEGNPQIVGIDAAGSELNCRPEVFAPYFRKIRGTGIFNFTFHAGEDFYDILDGIRTVDEVVNFMDYRFGDRIGHGLALGLNIFEYYNDRHYDIIIPVQILLDNLIWMKYKASEFNITLAASTLMFIEEQYRKLSVALGYVNVSSDPYDYYYSMRLRGDLCSERKGDDMVDIPDEIRFSPISTGQASSKEIRDLFFHYEYSTIARNKGKEVVAVKLPVSFSEDVYAIQESLLANLESRGIVIEANPSSNVRIGRFSRYDQHPITRFHSIDGDSSKPHAMMVSINTDDKGIFGTSLKNEYSLIALALRKYRDDSGKYRWNDAQIENYIRKIANYGNISRFCNVL